MSDELRLSSMAALNPVDSTNWSGRRQRQDSDSSKRRASAPEEEGEESETPAAAQGEELGGIIDVSA